jgi:hypothetical protein
LTHAPYHRRCATCSVVGLCAVVGSGRLAIRPTLNCITQNYIPSGRYYCTSIHTQVDAVLLARAPYRRRCATCSVVGLCAVVGSGRLAIRPTLNCITQNYIPTGRYYCTSIHTEVDAVLSAHAPYRRRCATCSEVGLCAAVGIGRLAIRPTSRGITQNYIHTDVILHVYTYLDRCGTIGAYHRRCATCSVVGLCAVVGSGRLAIRPTLNCITQNYIPTGRYYCTSIHTQVDAVLLAHAPYRRRCATCSEVGLCAAVGSGRLAIRPTVRGITHNYIHTDVTTARQYIPRSMRYY